MRVDHLTGRVSHGDLAGSNALAARDALLAAGVEGEVFAQEVFDGLPAQLYPRLRAGASALVYHAGWNSDGVSHFIANRSEPLVLVYLGIPPSQAWDRFDPGAGLQLDESRRQLQALAGRWRAAFSGSRFAAAELESIGILGAEVLPPFPPRRQTPDPRRVADLRSRPGRPKLISIGPVSPHAGQLDLIRSLAALRAAGHPGATLALVGEARPDTYRAALLRTAGRLEVPLELFGGLDPGELAARLAAADLFVTQSTYEGFASGIDAAMGAGLAVVAVRAGGVEETLSGAGAILDSRDPLLVGEAIGELLSRQGMLDDLRDRGARRAAELDAVDRTAAMLAAFERSGIA